MGHGDVTAMAPRRLQHVTVVARSCTHSDWCRFWPGLGPPPGWNRLGRTAHPAPMAGVCGHPLAALGVASDHTHLSCPAWGRRFFVPSG